MVYTKEQMQKVRGKVWEKDGMVRVYFNNVEALIGLDFTACRINGEYASRNDIRRVQDQLANSKFWYDLGTGKFTTYGNMTDSTLALITKVIEQKLGA